MFFEFWTLKIPVLWLLKLEDWYLMIFLALCSPCLSYKADLTSSFKKCLKKRRQMIELREKWALERLWHLKSWGIASEFGKSIKMPYSTYIWHTVYPYLIKRSKLDAAWVSYLIICTIVSIKTHFLYEEWIQNTTWF